MISLVLGSESLLIQFLNLSLFVLEFIFQQIIGLWQLSHFLFKLLESSFVWEVMLGQRERT